MKTLYPVPPDPSTDPVYLAAAAVHSLIQPLPSGTAFCIGVVLIVMMTGRLVQTKGSLARAVWPFVVHLRWGWHRVERAMERGTFSLDAMFDQAAAWCLSQMPVEPVHLGPAQREVNAIDSSTIARLRAGTRLALAGKGYCHRAGRAVRANIVAALTTVVMIEGVRVGLVRRTRFGASCEEAVARVFADLPPPQGTRLLERPASLSMNELTYLTTVMASAYLRMGQTPQARSLLAAQWNRLDHAGELSLSLRELQALALAGDNTALAQARAGNRSDETSVNGLSSAMGVRSARRGVPR